MPEHTEKMPLLGNPIVQIESLLIDPQWNYLRELAWNGNMGLILSHPVTQGKTRTF
jgi:hypothetical protein